MCVLNTAAAGRDSAALRCWTWIGRRLIIAKTFGTVTHALSGLCDRLPPIRTCYPGTLRLTYPRPKPKTTVARAVSAPGPDNADISTARMTPSGHSAVTLPRVLHPIPGQRSHPGG